MNSSTSTTPATFAEAVVASVTARMAAGMTEAEAVADLRRFLAAEAARHANLDHFTATGEWLD